jgi:uncharacterized membrane protein
MPYSRGVYIAWAMQGLILLNVIYGLATLNPHLVFIGLVGFSLTIIPVLVERRTSISLPWEVNFLIALAVFLHVAGYAQNWYILLYPYYDKMAHFISSITVALLGFVSILLVNRFSCIKMTRLQIFFYIIIFTMAIGAFWEIYEYLMDTFFGAFLVKPLQHGLDDTMIDLIFDLIGAVVVAVLGTLYIQKKTLDELTNPMVDDSTPECEL